MFSLILLPPILYEAAINMKKKYFYKNFGSILMYSVVGTFVSFVCTSLMFILITWPFN